MVKMLADRHPRMPVAGMMNLKVMPSLLSR
jgi:hypothetical protein